jgi:dTDP-4-dehydrorhamnose 3,5-epimerase
MRFIETDIRGVFVVELDRNEDERGFFARVWCRDELAEQGLTAGLAQCSISRNPKVSTLRGMHFQRAPHQEAKLVRAMRGAIFDVIIDLRPESETCGRWLGVTLDADGGRALYVPEGVAHGFQTLADDTDVLYFISVPYAPDAASGVRWDDPAFGIGWPHASQRTISDRDRSWPDWSPRRSARSVNRGTRAGRAR